MLIRCIEKFDQALHSTQKQNFLEGEFSEPPIGEYSEKLKSISTTDRLSKSVSDYVLKLEKQEYSIMQKDFTQVRLIILQRFLPLHQKLQV